MNICVYGSSSTELPESIMKGAFRMGELIAKAGHGMVYGGGAQGVMGASAMGARSAGGAVLGVAPRFFNVDGVLFEDCTEFIYTDTMRERKQIMEDRSDAFIVCPGGVGTFEEFFEILTLKQLSQHTKPIVILDIDGYYDPMLDMIKHAVDKGFVKPACLALYMVTDSQERALEYIENYIPQEIHIKDLRFDSGVEEEEK